jgi:hypothetical protein
MLSLGIKIIVEATRQQRNSLGLSKGKCNLKREVNNNNNNNNNNRRTIISGRVDRLCGPMVRVPSYRSRCLGFDSGATRFSEKYWVWKGVY